MARYVLRYSQANIPAEHLASIRAARGVRVVDESPRMILVDGEEAGIQAALASMPGWTAHRKVAYPIPDTRKKIE